MKVGEFGLPLKRSGLAKWAPFPADSVDNFHFFCLNVPSDFELGAGYKRFGGEHGGFGPPVKR